MMKELLFKVVLIGDPEVGKTSYVQKYVNNTFQTNYKMTMGVDFSLKVIRWSDNCNIKLQLWDIAGQESFTSMTHIYYRNASACLALFDVTRRETFRHSVSWKQDLDRKVTLRDGSPVPCLLLANKCDKEDERQVSQEEIEDLCREQDFMGWSEVSVKEGTMVKECIGFLIEEMMAKYSELEGSSDSDQQASGDSGRIKLGQEKSVESSSKCPC